MRKTAVLSILLLLVASFSLYANDSVRTYFPFLSKEATSLVLPVDSVIGQTAGSDSSETHLLLKKALGESYSYEWTQTYLAEETRASLVQLFGTWLSENLGKGGAIFSTLHRNQDGSVGINVRLNGSCMAFVLSEGRIVSMSQLGR